MVEQADAVPRQETAEGIMLSAGDMESTIRNTYALEQVPGILCAAILIRLILAIEEEFFPATLAHSTQPIGTHDTNAINMDSDTDEEDFSPSTSLNAIYRHN